MRFKTFITEAAFSSAKLERVASLLTGAIGKKIGQTFWRMGGSGHLEKFKRDGGKSGVGISYILDNGRMVRFNLENDSDSSELSSVDVWKNLKDLSKPTMTLEIPSEFNSVEAVNTIATFIQSFKVTIREMFELLEAGERKSKYDDKEALGKQFGVPEHLPDDKFRQAVFSAKTYLKLTGKSEISSLTQEIENAQQIAKKAKLDPETLFQDLEDLVYLVAKGSQPSLMVAGSPGLGKTFIVTKKLTEELGSEGKRWVKVTGKTSPLGMYAALFVNRNKVVVFDDCDSVFNNEDSVNILKGALDTTEKREVSWISPSTINVSKMDDEQKDELYASIESSLEDGDMAGKVKFPSRFEFVGKVIFISNLPIDKLPDAIKSRSFVIDITLDKEGVLTRMKQVLPYLCKDSSMEDKQEVLDLLVQDGDKLNMRTFVGAIRIKESGNPRWQELVKRYA